MTIHPIYRTSDYRKALSHLIREKKAGDATFSIAVLAENIGVQKTYISLVLNGQRDFSADQVYAIARFFDLEQASQDYLLLLLECSRTGLAVRKRELQRKIAQIQARHRDVKKNLRAEALTPPTTSEMAEVFLDPYVVVVLNFLNIDRYQRDPQKIATELGLSKSQLQRVVKTLEAANAIRYLAKERRYELIRDHIHLDNNSPLALPHLVAIRQLSSQHIQKIPADEKLTFSVTLTADDRTRVMIHEAFLKFLREVEPLVKAAPADEIYQINFDLFPWNIQRS